MVREFNSQIYLESSDYSNTACWGAALPDPSGALSDSSDKTAHPPGSASEAPRQGCSVFSPGVEEGRKPRRRPRDSSVGKFPSTPPGRRTDCLTGKCDTLSGSYLFMMVNRFPGSSALRASTTGLKAGDPSGAPPLRDRQAG